MKSRIRLLASVLMMSMLGGAQAGQVAHQHVATEHLGRVHFDTSCKAEAQPRFDRAVALMHSFQFGPAIAGFRAVLAIDPECAIAYWGMALSDWSNPFAGFKSPTQLAQGLKAVTLGRAATTATPRERAYLEAVATLYTDSARLDQRSRALAYAAAMERVATSYPNDTEASIFHALALAAAADPTDKTHARQLRAGAILQGLFALYPDHPGLAHYIIHAYDEPELASRAAEAARRYGQIAPSTPHALHMPSHTFTRLGDWQASIDSNLASASAARAAGQPADELHASDYLVYAFLQTGQDRAAKQWMDSAAKAFSRFNPSVAMGAAPASTAYFARAAIPARYVLERRDWAGAARLDTPPGNFPFADAVTCFARGLGAAHEGDKPGARAAIRSLEHIHEALVKGGEAYWAAQIDIQRREVAATLALAEGNTASARAGMRLAAELEDGTELSSITPGPLLPAREMLGEMLLDMKLPVDALTAFKTSLAQEPNRFWSLYGAARAARAAGDDAAAHGYFRKLLLVARKADLPPRAELVAAQEEVAH